MEVMQSDTPSEAFSPSSSCRDIRETGRTCTAAHLVGRGRMRFLDDYYLLLRVIDITRIDAE